jgi:hypothetical protein
VAFEGALMASGVNRPGGRYVVQMPGGALASAGSGSRGSLGDLKIIPGRAVMLGAGAVSAETLN